VDPTPRDRAESARGGAPALHGRRGRESAAAHELGHLAGLDADHDAGHAAVMGDALPTGTRRRPTAAAVPPAADGGARGSVPHAAPVAHRRAARRR
jgi:hypothetical protein